MLENIPSQKKAFLAICDEYQYLKSEFKQPIPIKAHITLDKHYLTKWIEHYIECFQNKIFRQGLPMIKYFASSEIAEVDKYNTKLAKFWSKMIDEAKINMNMMLKQSLSDPIMSKVMRVIPAKSFITQSHKVALSRSSDAVLSNPWQGLSLQS